MRTGSSEIGKHFYLCDGKAHCAYSAFGKKNKYCYIWGGDEAWCKHTSDIKHAKNSEHVYKRNENGNYFEIEGKEISNEQ